MRTTILFQLFRFSEPTRTPEEVADNKGCTQGKLAPSPSHDPPFLQDAAGADTIRFVKCKCLSFELPFWERITRGLQGLTADKH